MSNSCSTNGTEPKIDVTCHPLHLLCSSTDYRGNQVNLVQINSFHMVEVRWVKSHLQCRKTVKFSSRQVKDEACHPRGWIQKNQKVSGGISKPGTRNTSLFLSTLHYYPPGGGARAACIFQPWKNERIYWAISEISSNAFGCRIIGSCCQYAE